MVGRVIEAGRPVESFVDPVAENATDEEKDLRRVSVRDEASAWLSAFDVKTSTWKEETWFGERVDPQFAEKRGPSSSSGPRRRPPVWSLTSTKWGRRAPRAIPA